MAVARLLLVEDTVSLATLYREYLRDERYEIRHAPNHGEARGMLDREPPDAVLLDLRLPDGDGHKLLAEIRARRNPPPVIVTLWPALPDDLSRLIPGATWKVASSTWARLLLSPLASISCLP